MRISVSVEYQLPMPRPPISRVPTAFTSSILPGLTPGIFGSVEAWGDPIAGESAAVEADGADAGAGVAGADVAGVDVAGADVEAPGVPDGAGVC